MSLSTTVSGVKRLSLSEVNLTPLTEADLPTIAKGLYECFPEEWWSKHEPLSTRPPPDIRISRLAKRFKPWLSKPGAQLTVARLASTGEFLGFAGWQQTPDTDGRILNMFTRRAVDDLGFAKQQGWSQGEIDEMWEAVDLDFWESEIGGQDVVRQEEMGDEPHWYLAPLWVFPKWQGHGIGSMLLREAIEAADSHDPPQPMYLEALPAARSIYAHLGWEGREGAGREMVMIRRGPRKHVTSPVTNLRA